MLPFTSSLMRITLTIIIGKFSSKLNHYNRCIMTFFSSNSRNTNITLKLYVIIFFLCRYTGGTFIIQLAAPVGNLKRILCSYGLGLLCDKHCSISFPALEVKKSFLIFIASKFCLAVSKSLIDQACSARWLNIRIVLFLCFY